jgi:hypothetical protein
MDTPECGIVNRTGKVQALDRRPKRRIERNDFELAGDSLGNDSGHGWLPGWEKYGSP